MIFIRIGTNSSSSYIKSTLQFILRDLPPLIMICRLSHNFLNSGSIDISDVIYWSEDKSINDSETERCRIHGKSSLIDSKSSSTLPDNPPVLQSK